jgi:hypothetical protein
MSARGGIHLSCDLMANSLALYGTIAALQVARELGAKVEAPLTAAAGSAKALSPGRTARFLRF